MTTTEVEVTHVSRDAIWLRARGRELFVPFNDFPWFKEAPIGKIMNVLEPAHGHFRWPDLDIDLGIETIEHPDRFPLKARSGS